MVHEAFEFWWSNLGHVGSAASCRVAFQSLRELMSLAESTIVQALKLAAAHTDPTFEPHSGELGCRLSQGARSTPLALCTAHFQQVCSIRSQS